MVQASAGTDVRKEDSMVDGNVDGKLNGGKANGDVKHEQNKKRMEEDGVQVKVEELSTEDEDGIVAKAADIGSLRALVAQAYKPPCPEPSRPMSHWDHMLSEVTWMANDVAQERLWKATVAYAIAVEIARKEGKFGLKQPPEGCRKYSDEIAQLKLEKAKELGQTTGRRSKALPPPSTQLEIDTEDDPGLRELVDGASELKIDVPENISDFDFTVQWDRMLEESMKNQIKTLENKRTIAEEVQYRSHRLEYEAALASHQMAIAEQQAAENALDEYELGQTLDLDILDDGLLGPPRKQMKRARGHGMYGTMDDYADERKEALYHDRRRQKSYREADFDPTYSTDTGRYGTRRVAQGRRRLDRSRSARPGVRPEYQQQNRMHGQPGSLVWNRSEDELLLAVVHEFGLNWTLVSEVLSRSLSMHGIYRPAQQCRQRFRQLMMQDNQGFSEEKAYAHLSTKLGKQQARELLMNSLPVRDDALVRFLEALAQVGASAKNRREAEEKRAKQIRTQRQEPHTSYTTVLNGIMQQTGGRRLSPLELSVHVSNTYAQQTRQMPLPGQQQIAPGNPQQPGTFTGQPNAQGAVADQRNLQSAPIGGQQSSLGIPAGQPAPGQNMPGGTGIRLPGPASQLTNSINQLNSILQNNKLPNGQILNEETKKNLEEKRMQLLLKFQQQQQAALAQRQALSGHAMQTPQQAGQIPSTASIAAVQTSNQAAIQPTGRPQMGTVLPGAVHMYAGGAIQGMPGAPQMGQPQMQMTASQILPNNMMAPGAQHQMMQRQGSQQQGPSQK